MVVLALLAASVASQPAPSRPGAMVRATATIRIITGTRITLGQRESGAELRRTQLRDRDGFVRAAHLTEFE